MFIKTRVNDNTSEFRPTNPQKYIGRFPILIRSSWERMFAQWLDLTPSVIKWSSESIQIPYYDPVQRKKRRYYPDFYFEVQGGKRYIIEVKPKRDIILSKKGRLNKAQKMMREQVYTTNQAKFRAAEDYCKKAGVEFKILTEKELFNK
jgi:hypothetical protein